MFWFKEQLDQITDQNIEKSMIWVKCVVLVTTWLYPSHLSSDYMDRALGWMQWFEKKINILPPCFVLGAAIAVEANNKRQAVTFILKPGIRNKIRVLPTTQA